MRGGRGHHGWRRAGSLIGLAALLAGCAAGPPEPRMRAEAVATPPDMADGGTAASPASRLAADLIAAEAAFAAGDSAALSATILRIERRNARPLDMDAPDPMIRWRADAPAIAPPLRGRVLGPGYVRGTLARGAATNINQIFLSGQAATIAAESRPADDMRLRVFDAEGALVCDRYPANARDCRFTPLFTQRYRIELHNGGNREASYFLVVD